MPSFLQRLSAAIRAARAAYAAPHGERAALPAAFTPPPEAAPPEPPLLAQPKGAPVPEVKPRVWAVSSDPETWFVYEAMSAYTWEGFKSHEEYAAHITRGGFAKEPHYARHCAYNLLCARAKGGGRLGYLDWRTSQYVVPTAPQLYWHWLKQAGLLGKNQDFYGLMPEVFWVNDAPIAVMRENRVSLVLDKGELHHYVTQVVLPQPTFTLRETYRVDRELKSHLKTLLVESA